MLLIFNRKSKQFHVLGTNFCRFYHVLSTNFGLFRHVLGTNFSLFYHVFGTNRDFFLVSASVLSGQSMPDKEKLPACGGV
jgi:hypothetical protein